MFQRGGKSDKCGFCLSKETLEEPGEGVPVGLDALFPPTFMRRYTHSQTIGEFIEVTGSSAETCEQLDAILRAAPECFVCAQTTFSSWGEMRTKAVAEYLGRRLKLDA